MDEIKVEPDSDDETSAACAFVECQLTEQDSDTAALNKINSHCEVSLLHMLLPYIKFKICCSLKFGIHFLPSVESCKEGFFPHEFGPQ
jgi:hypothetical protein